MLLSVIVPMYNVEKYVGKTLTSLIYQNGYNLEVIIIDDGSSDNSYNIASQIMFNSKIDYKIIKVRNGGVSVARNKGLEEAKGKYVVFLDGDDFVSENFLEGINSITKEYGEIDVVSWGYNTVSTDGEVFQYYFDKYNNPPVKIMTGPEALKNILIEKRLWVCTGNIAIRRTYLLMSGLRYTEGCSNGEDQEFTFKVLSQAKGVFFTKRILTNYVRRPGSASNSFNINRFDAINAIERTALHMETVSLNEIANYLSNDHIIINFLNNYTASLKGLSNLDPQKGKKMIIQAELEMSYPGLLLEIRKKMEQYSGGNKKLKLLILCYLVSPLLLHTVLSVLDAVTRSGRRLLKPREGLSK
ncbi:glycosyltransferase family 2 protein [Paenibacillus antri]|uniref:Glycosyltransferase family 2 protein n=1 Tax=Paenibacillus antri TaxID=2582848 RepID=A0A5R9GA63_9BACL|nr:glycosyltransferase family A protein [Paenibacillus antri]TLS51999.1 glycosyltransferase family 2 protein [Paenibacillus antri]